MPFQDPFKIFRLLLTIALSEFVRSGFFVVLLPLSATQTGLLSVGLLTSVHYLVDALAKAPMALWVERVGLGRLLVLAAVMGLISMYAMLYLPFYVAVVCSGLWGLLISPMWATTMTLVSKDAKAGQENQALNVANIAIAPGVALGMLGVAQFNQMFPHRTQPLIFGAEGLVLLLAVSLMWLPKEHNTEQKIDLSALKNVIFLAPAAVLQTMIPSLFTPVLLRFLKEVGLELKDLIGMVVVMLLLGVVALTGAGKAKNVNPRLFIVLGLGGMLACMLMLALGNYQHLLSGYGYAALGFLGFGFGLFLSGWNGLVVKSLPEQHRAAIWGGIMMLESLGYGLGPSLGGLAWDTFGLRGPFYMAIVLIIIAQSYYVLLRSRQ